MKSAHVVKCVLFLRVFLESRHLFLKLNTKGSHKKREFIKSVDRLVAENCDHFDLGFNGKDRDDNINLKFGNYLKHCPKCNKSRRVGISGQFIEICPQCGDMPW